MEIPCLDAIIVSFTDWNKNTLTIKSTIFPFYIPTNFGFPWIQRIKEKKKMCSSCCFSLVVKSYSDRSIAHLCNQLCCLADWKTVSVNVFGMKHLRDTHLLLLVLLYLLGAATSQVNPGLCAFFWLRVSIQVRLQWDHIRGFVNPIKWILLHVFGPSAAAQTATDSDFG